MERKGVHPDRGPQLSRQTAPWLHNLLTPADITVGVTPVRSGLRLGVRWKLGVSDTLAPYPQIWFLIK